MGFVRKDNKQHFFNKLQPDEKEKQPLKMFHKEAALKNFEKFTGKHLP